MALIAATLAMAGYGTYKYYQAYIQPTPQIILDSSKFIINIFHNPLSIIDNLGGLSIDAYLAEKEAKMLRALGLAPSIINPASYFKPRDTSYLDRLAYQEYEKVSTLFERLHKIGDLPAHVNFASKGYDHLKDDIRKAALDTFMYMIIARSSLPQEKASNAAFMTYDQFRNENKEAETALDLALRRVVEFHYKPSEELQAENHGALLAYVKFMEYIIEPRLYRSQMRTIAEVSQLASKFKNERDKLEQALYGGAAYQYLAGMASSRHTLAYQGRERKAINEFYELLKGRATSDAAIKEQAYYLAFLMLRRLPQELKLKIIRAYFEESYGLSAS